MILADNNEHIKWRTEQNWTDDTNVWENSILNLQSELSRFSAPFLVYADQVISR